MLKTSALVLFAAAVAGSAVAAGVFQSSATVRPAASQPAPAAAVAQEAAAAYLP